MLFRSRLQTTELETLAAEVLPQLPEVRVVVYEVLPEFVVRHWWGNILHNQTALLLKGRLLFRKGTVVTSLPYHLE